MAPGTLHESLLVLKMNGTPGRVLPGEWRLQPAQPGGHLSGRVGAWTRYMLDRDHGIRKVPDE